MTNMNLIEQATKLAIEYFEMKGLTMNTLIIKQRVLNWYIHSDIADAEMLAAAAIVDDYDLSYTYEDIISWKEFHFPEVPIEHQGYIHVSELLD